MAKTCPRSIRLNTILLEHLYNLAQIQNRSVNNLIETILQDYVEEYELLSNPEFREALKEAEIDEGVSWREAMKIV